MFLRQGGVGAPPRRAQLPREVPGRHARLMNPPAGKPSAGRTDGVSRRSVLGDVEDYTSRTAELAAAEPALVAGGAPSPRRISDEDLPFEVRRAVQEAPERAQEAFREAYVQCLDGKQELQEQLQILRKSRRMGPMTSLDGGGTLRKAPLESGPGLPPRKGNRHERAMRNFQKFEKKWAAVERDLSEKSGRDPQDLVMERGNEFRHKKEILEHVNLSIPLQERHGADQWSMSLRDSWTRYVPVGNIFSGLFCPVEDKPGAGELEIIRHHPPKAQKELEAERTASLQPAYMTFGMVARTMMVARELKSRGRGWEDSEWLRQKMTQYKHKMDKVLPHAPEVEGLEVEGKGVEDGLEQFAFGDITLNEVEEMLAATNQEAWNVITEDRAEKRATSFFHRKAASTLGSAMEEALRPEEKLKGPQLDLSAKRVAIECLRGRTGRGSVAMNNIGTTTLHYKWTRLEEELLPGSTGGSAHHRFYNSDQCGEILPGETREVSFSFRSSVAGAFREKWALSTFPETPSGELLVVIVATAVAEDGHKLQCRNMDLRLASTHRNRVVAEQVERLIADISDPEPAPAPPIEEPNWARFTARNLSSEPAVYFSGETWEGLRALWGEMAAAQRMKGIAVDGVGGESAEDAAEAAAESTGREWDGALESLEHALQTLEEAAAQTLPEAETPLEADADANGAASGDERETDKNEAQFCAEVEEFRLRFKGILRSSELPEHRRDIVARAACAAILRAADQIEAAVDEQKEAFANLDEATSSEAMEETHVEGVEAEEEGAEGGEAPASDTGPSLAEQKEQIQDKTLENVFSAFVSTVGRLDGAIERESAAVAAGIAGRLHDLSNMASQENADAPSILWDSFDLNRRLKHLGLVDGN